MVPYSGFGEANMRFDGNGSITLNNQLLPRIYIVQINCSESAIHKVFSALKFLRRSLKTPLSNFFTIRIPNP